MKTGGSPMKKPVLALLLALTVLAGGCAQPAAQPETTAPETTQTEPTETLPPVTQPETTAPTVTEPPATEPTEPEPEAPAEILEEYQALYLKNNDLVGWISIPGTKIDYPVVQSPYERNYYLRRNFDKQSATAGTIYVREECDVFAPSDNLTIYGHNMRNGTMFADMHKFKEEAFWLEYNTIAFNTLYERHTYEIFAVFVSCADMSDKANFRYHLFDDAANEAEFDAFVERCLSMSLYDTHIRPQYGDKLITLSTCDKSIDDGRLVIVARRMD